MAPHSSARDIDILARQWWQRHPNDPRLRLGKAVVAENVESLERILDCRDGTTFRGTRTLAPWLRNALAFVYPGLGNQFAGMGRALRPSGLMCSSRRTRRATYLTRSARSPRLVE